MAVSDLEMTNGLGNMKGCLTWMSSDITASLLYKYSVVIFTPYFTVVELTLKIQLFAVFKGTTTTVTVGDSVVRVILGGATRRVTSCHIPPFPVHVLNEDPTWMTHRSTLRTSIPGPQSTKSSVTIRVVVDVPRSVITSKRRPSALPAVGKQLAASNGDPLPPCLSVPTAALAPLLYKLSLVGDVRMLLFKTLKKKISYKT
ncbi:hypothetical protein J6590_010084 [Homalodisca vitripennis]|nr:hypothetical protein J6590_010084 [Homalodisca vitripennis]